MITYNIYIYMLERERDGLVAHGLRDHGHQLLVELLLVRGRGMACCNITYYNIIHYNTIILYCTII